VEIDVPQIEIECDVPIIEIGGNEEVSAAPAGCCWKIIAIVALVFALIGLSVVGYLTYHWTVGVVSVSGGTWGLIYGLYAIPICLIILFFVSCCLLRKANGLPACFCSKPVESEEVAVEIEAGGNLVVDAEIVVEMTELEVKASLEAPLVEVEIEIEVPVIAVEVEFEAPVMEIEVEAKSPKIENEVELEIPMVEIEVEAPQVEIELGIETGILEVEVATLDINADLNLDANAKPEIGGEANAEVSSPGCDKTLCCFILVIIFSIFLVGCLGIGVYYGIAAWNIHTVGAAKITMTRYYYISGTFNGLVLIFSILLAVACCRMRVAKGLPGCCCASNEAVVISGGLEMGGGVDGDVEIEVEVVPDFNVDANIG